MFCPNCGAQNQDTATACAKCGFTLKAAATAPKFKGTMLMMNAPPAAAPRPAGGPAPVAAPPPAAPGAPPAAAPQAPPQAPAAQVPPAARPKLKGTMIGVAPPSIGSNIGPSGGPPPAAAPPQPAFAPPPAQPAYEPPPAPASPPSAVNPLGGTVVADTSAFQSHSPGGGGFPPAGQPSPGAYGAPPPAAAYGATQAFGAPPPAYGAQQQPGMGGPQGYGAPPPGFGASPDALGATTPAADGQQQAPLPQTSSMAQVHDSLAPIPGTVGGANPIVTVLLIVLTCGIYGIYLLVKGKKSAPS